MNNFLVKSASQRANSSQKGGWFIALVLCLVVFSVGAARAEFRSQSIDNDYAYEIEVLAEENKRLILFFHQPGCPYCDKMRARVFPHAEVQDYYSKHFVLLENNIKGNLDVVMPDGSEGTEADFGRKLRVRATPVIAFFDTDGTLALQTTGYLDPKQFLLAGRYVTDGVFKSDVSFFRYLKNGGKVTGKTQ